MTRLSWLTAPSAVATLLTLATAAGGAWLGTRWHQQQGVAAQAYSMNTAIELAGAAVPEGVESFYFFPLDAAAPDPGPELLAMLQQAAAEHEYVGITGADAQYNLDTLLAVLAAPRDGSLAGLVIVYVGPADHEARLRASVTGAGAELHFVTYSPTPDTGAI